MIPRQTLGRLRDLRKAKQAHEARADAALAEAERHVVAAAQCDRDIDATLDEARAGR